MRAKHLGDLASEADVAGSWAEGCNCHEGVDEDAAKDNSVLAKLLPGPIVLASSCPFRGCRAVELSTGRGLEIQRSKLLQDRVAWQILQIFAALFNVFTLYEALPVTILHLELVVWCYFTSQTFKIILLW